MPGQTRTVIAAGAVAYGQGGDEVILLYSEESIEHSRKVGGSAFAEALVHLTKPLDIASTDQRAPDVEERLVDCQLAPRSAPSHGEAETVGGAATDGYDRQVILRKGVVVSKRACVQLRQRRNLARWTAESSSRVGILASPPGPDRGPPVLPCQS